MLNRPVEPQPVKKIRPPLFNERKTASLICPALPDSTNSRNSRMTSSSASKSNFNAAAVSCFANSLKLAVMGCDDSVTSTPSLNWPLIFKKSSERFCERVLIRVRVNEIVNSMSRR
jgi:hypothetical protein